MTALDEYQAQLGDSGILLGRDQDITIMMFEGLDRQPKAADAERENADGAVLAPDYAQSRTVTLTLKIHKDTPAAAQVVYNTLADAWNSMRGSEGAQNIIPFRWRLPGEVARRLEGGRPRRLAIDPSTLGTRRLIVLATYFAPDPRMLADAQQVIDLDYNDTATTLDNDGNHPAAVEWAVNGAVTNPGVIRNEAARFDLAATISSDVYYMVRTDRKTVTRSSDNANRFQDISGTPAEAFWLEVPAGGAGFRSVGTSPGAGKYVRATYRDTWL